MDEQESEELHVLTDDSLSDTVSVERESHVSVGRVLKSALINMFLPFVNGMMLGFGEIMAHEVAFRLGWGGTRVFPARRREPRSAIDATENSLQQNENESLHIHSSFY